MSENITMWNCPEVNSDLLMIDEKCTEPSQFPDPRTVHRLH